MKSLLLQARGSNSNQFHFNEIKIYYFAHTQAKHEATPSKHHSNAIKTINTDGTVNTEHTVDAFHQICTANNKNAVKSADCWWLCQLMRSLPILFMTNVSGNEIGDMLCFVVGVLFLGIREKRLDSMNMCHVLSLVISTLIPRNWDFLRKFWEKSTPTRQTD